MDRPAAARQRRSSLIVGLVAALLAVAALPFALAAYQIHLARESLVDQAQRTHLIAARATADRIAAERQAVLAAADSAAQNPQLYTEPASGAAREVLAGILVGQADVLAAATFYRDGERDVLVQMARRPGAEAIDANTLQAQTATLQLETDQQQRRWGLSRATARPGLRLALLADAARLVDTLEPRELGPSARLLLMQGEHAHPAFPDPVPLPEPLLAAIRQPQLDALAARSDAGSGIEVSAFARIVDSDWSIVSLQPAAEAEAAAATMRRGALAAMIAVALLVAALSVFAWRRVVQPVRALLDWQRGVLAGGGGAGGDLASLKAAFQQIKQHQRNREALHEVFLGRYKLLSTLGQGAMGSVFLAWDPRLKRHAAIKTIHIDALDPRMRKHLAQTLENEAVAIANLRHPNVVGVFDLVAAGDFAFVVMEYIEGGSLRGLISRNGALEPEEVALIGCAMLRALDAAHGAGLLHLDIKPGNVLVPPEGQLQLTDFGVSTWRFEIPDLVARGGLAGTPGFIAPEYVNGAAPSERSDLYSLGILLVECLTGVQQNLPGAKTNDLRRAAQRPTVLPDHLQRRAPELCAAILALCELDPAKRPPSAAAALRLFEKLPQAGAEQSLAARARAIASETPLSGAPTPGADSTQPPPAIGDATRPAPLALPSESSNPGSAAPTSAAESIHGEATRPPPPRLDLEASRAPGWTAAGAGTASTPTRRSGTAGTEPAGGPDSTHPLPREPR